MRQYATISEFVLFGKQDKTYTNSPRLSVPVGLESEIFWIIIIIINILFIYFIFFSFQMMREEIESSKQWKWSSLIFSTQVTSVPSAYIPRST